MCSRRGSYVFVVGVLLIRLAEQAIAVVRWVRSAFAGERKRVGSVAPGLIAR